MIKPIKSLRIEIFTFDNENSLWPKLAMYS